MALRMGSNFYSNKTSPDLAATLAGFSGVLSVVTGLCLIPLLKNANFGH
jgi:hypothetical protein